MNVSVKLMRTIRISYIFLSQGWTCKMKQNIWKAVRVIPLRYELSGPGILMFNNTNIVQIPYRCFKPFAFSCAVQKVITICSVYLPLKQQQQISELDTFVSQFASPRILLGDFNRANQFWSSASNNTRGDLMENFLTNNNVYLMISLPHFFIIGIVYFHQ